MRPRALLLLALPLAARAPLAAQVPNELTAQERADGWRLLFDGRTTAGWRGYHRQGIPAGWQVREGALTRVAAAGDIVTTGKFESFDLTWDWKIAPGGNSGVLYHVTEEADEPYESGPEYQILDDARSRPDGLSRLTSAGACYALYPVVRQLAKPAGQWNHSRLLVDRGHVTHWLNGVKAAEYTLGSPDWDRRVAASKFNEWPQFGKAATGFIDLQDHGSEVAYRNLKIRELR